MALFETPSGVNVPTSSDYSLHVQRTGQVVYVDVLDREASNEEVLDTQIVESLSLSREEANALIEALR
jgi:hypothetical protein